MKVRHERRTTALTSSSLLLDESWLSTAKVTVKATSRQPTASTSTFTHFFLSLLRSWPPSNGSVFSSHNSGSSISMSPHSSEQIVSRGPASWSSCPLSSEQLTDQEDLKIPTTKSVLSLYRIDKIHKTSTMLVLTRYMYMCI